MPPESDIPLVVCLSSHIIPASQNISLNSYTILCTVHNYTLSLSLPDLANVSISIHSQCLEENGNSPYIGSEVIITCVAEGEPFPRVTWFFMNRELTGSEDLNINFRQNNRALVISSLQSNNSGYYSCRSENDLFPFKQSSQIHLGFQGWG